MGCDSDNNGNNGPDEYLLDDVEFRGWSSADFNAMSVGTLNGEIAYNAIYSDTIIAEITRSCVGANQSEAEACIDSVVITENIVGDHLYLTANMPGNSDHDYRAEFDIMGSGSIFTEFGVVVGSIILNSMLAGTDLNCVTGSITVENHQGGINGQLVTGNIDCELTAVSANDIDSLRVYTGNIDLSLPSDVSLEFDATAAIGSVTVSGFPSIAYTINEPNHKAGTIGNGEASMNISILTGNITISAQ
jgi:hypothetical protein